MVTGVVRMQREVARVLLREWRLRCRCVCVMFVPCQTSIAACSPLAVAVVCSASACRRLKAAPQGGLASGHDGRSRTDAQATSCLVLGCKWRSFSRWAPASSSNSSFTHAMVNGLAALQNAPRPQPRSLRALEHSCCHLQCCT